ncbi:MAG: YIP1 family protein [Gemmatimonadaceae bacterium]|jgi:hypothetical protein|nr:YIP1 family protein [Gemmatimonadaceae bacterium]
MTTPTLPEYAPLPAKTSVWEDCLDIFYSPREVFERRRDGKFWVPLLVFAVLVGVLAFLGRQAFDAIQDVAIRESFAKQGMSPEQAAQARAMTEKFKTVGYAFAPVIWVVLGLVVGLVFWVLARLFGATLTVAQGITIWVLASYPNLVNTAAVVAQSFFVDPNTVTHKHAYSLSAARFLSADMNPFVMKLASLADPFVIWSGVLLGIGAHVIAKLEKEKAAALAVVATLLYVLAFA